MNESYVVPRQVKCTRIAVIPCRYPSHCSDETTTAPSTYLYNDVYSMIETAMTNPRFWCDSRKTKLKTNHSLYRNYEVILKLKVITVLTISLKYIS